VLHLAHRLVTVLALLLDHPRHDPHERVGKLGPEMARVDGYQRLARSLVNSLFFCTFSPPCQGSADVAEGDVA